MGSQHQHCPLVCCVGEVPCDNDDPETENEYLEAKAILDFAPNRLGHSLLLPPVLQHTLLHKKIPVESCPTSNVMTLELARCHSGSILQGLKTHPQLADWIENFHPFSIGTDDPGVFHTNPTKELLLVQKAFDLDSNRLSQIVVMSMDHAFCIDETRRLVKERIENRIIHLSNLS